MVNVQYLSFIDVPQIHFLCEAVDPCTPEDVLVDVHICGKANPPCTTEMRNTSSQERPPGWYLCKTEMDGHVLHNNTSVSGECVCTGLSITVKKHLTPLCMLHILFCMNTQENM